MRLVKIILILIHDEGSKLFSLWTFLMALQVAHKQPRCTAVFCVKYAILSAGLFVVYEKLGFQLDLAFWVG